LQSQTRIFSQIVRDTMRPAQVVLSADTSVAEMLTRMSGVRTTCALITDGDGRLLGLVTEQDVTRRVALKCSGQEPVSSVMTSPVETVRAEDFLYRAIARMRRFRWRHMPVIDRDERPVGEIMLNDALGVAAEQAIHQIDLVAHEGGIEGLREVKAAQVQIATELQSDKVPAPEIQALITDINRGIHRLMV